MIQCFRHESLQRLYAKADSKGLPAEMVPKIERIIARLDVATSPDMMNLPGLKLHSLRKSIPGSWSIWVMGNWRIIFCMEESNVFDVDLVDYH